MDGTNVTYVAPKTCESMASSISDIHAYSSRHTLSTLLLVAGKDKIVDNKGARDFYSNIKSVKKQIK